VSGLNLNWKLSQSIVAGMRDAYRRIFEEGYFGRTIHDVTAWYNSNKDNQPNRGDDEQQKQNKIHSQDNGISM
jgi:hypothetical protein